MNSIIRSLGIILITCLLQVLIFRYGVFSGGWIIICFHIYGLILLPIGLSKTSYIIIGAIVGALLDIVLLTGGLHMSAGLIAGLLIPKFTRLIEPRDGFSREHSINVLQDGWGQFIALSTLVTFIYMLSLFAVEGWKWSLLPTAILKAGASTVVNVILFGMYHGMFGPQPKRKKSTSHW